MGAGRKTTTFNPAMQSQQQKNAHTGNISVPARHLQDNQLGGVIFGCKHNTIGECLSKQLFGLPSFHYSYVRNVKPGMPLFLFNYSDRKMHGIFEAASAGQMLIDQYAWSGDGSVKTPFPAQVRICVKTRCLPIPEKQYRSVIGDNYYHLGHFYFELDHAQTNGLISLFRPAPVPANIKQVPVVPSTNNLSIPSLLTKSKASVVPVPANTKASFKDCNPFAVFSSPDDVVPDDWYDSDADRNASQRQTSASDPDETDMRELVSDWEDLDDDALRNQLGLGSIPDEDNEDSSEKSVAIEEVETVEDNGVETGEDNYPYVTLVNGDGVNHNLLQHAPSDDMFVNLHDKNSGVMNSGDLVTEEVSQNNPNGVGQGPNKLTILQKLKELSILREHSVLSFKVIVDDSSDQCVPEEAQADGGFPEEPFKAAIDDSKPSETMEDNAPSEPVEDNVPYEQYHGNVELVQIINELTKKTEALEKKQIESNQEILSLKELVKDSGRKVQQLEHRIEELHKYKSSLSLLAGKCTIVDRPSIFLIGGYDGITWLSSLGAFSPKNDRLLPLKPMSVARSYASAAVLKDAFFVFGGGDGGSWYRTVECYDTRSNEWIKCPDLNREKGSLAGATVNNKIFAIGGGDGYQSFSEVEMLDPVLGKWIYSKAMLQPRFAPAAAELNGLIYVVGGYDGSNYLQSAERYDPREGFWVRLPSMKTRRGCHSLAVLGETLEQQKRCFNCLTEAIEAARGMIIMKGIKINRYALGGHDGEGMVSSVEIFDPRLNVWRMGDPMSDRRGYASAVTLNDSLFIFGGLRSNDQIVDTVEVYNESSGWSIPGFKSNIGKRCFFSAVVM